MSDRRGVSPGRNTSTRRHVLGVAVVLVVTAVVVPWVGTALADQSASTVGLDVPDPTSETDGETGLPTESAANQSGPPNESDSPPGNGSDSGPPNGSDQSPTNGSDSGPPNGSDSGPPDGSDSGPPNESNSSPENGSNPTPENASDHPTNRSNSSSASDGPTPKNGIPPSDGQSGPPARPGNETNASANRSGPSNRGNAPTVTEVAHSERANGAKTGANGQKNVVRSVEAVASNVTANRPAVVNVSSVNTPTDPVSFDAVSVTPANDTSFTLNVTASDDPIANETPATDLPNGTESLSYLSVDHSIPDENVTNVTFTFRVRKDRVNASERDEIVFYRFHDGSWNPLPTNHTATTDIHYVYRVRSPGLSEFAAGKQSPQFEIADASVELDTLSVGDTLDVRVRVSNHGDADGTFTATLALDGVEITSRQLTIAAGGMRQTTFDPTVARPGTYVVYVNDYRVAEVTVESEDETDFTRATGLTAVTDDESDTVRTSDDSDGDTNQKSAVPGFGVRAVVVALLSGLLVGRLRD